MLSVDGSALIHTQKQYKSKYHALRQASHIASSDITNRLFSRPSQHLRTCYVTSIWPKKSFGYVAGTSNRLFHCRFDHGHFDPHDWNRVWQIRSFA